MAFDKNKLKTLLFNDTPKTTIEAPEDEEEQKKLREQYYKQLQEYLFTPGAQTEGKQLGEQRAAWVDDVSDRKLLTQYYDAYSKNLQDAAERGDATSYYKYKYITDKLADKIGAQKSVGTWFADAAQAVPLNVADTFANIVINPAAGAYYGAEQNIDADSLYNIAQRSPGSKMNLTESIDYQQLKKFSEEFPEDETIKKLLNYVEMGNFKGDKGAIEYMVRDINNLKSGERTKKFIGEHTADEAQRVEDLKQKEHLTGYSWPAQLGLDAVDEITSMLTSMGLAYGIGSGLGLSTTATGTLTTAGMGLGKAGQQLADKLDQGYDFDKAMEFATLSGLNEYVWENISGDFVNAAFAGGINRTPLGSAMQKFLNKTGLKNKAAKATLLWLGNINSEGFEEVFTGITDAVLESIVLEGQDWQDLGKNVDWKSMGKELTWSYVESIIPTIVLGGFGQVQVNRYISEQEKVLLNSIDKATNLNEAEKELLRQGVREASQDARMGLTEDWDNMMVKLTKEINKAELTRISQDIQESINPTAQTNTQTNTNVQQPTQTGTMTTIRPPDGYQGDEYTYLKQFYPSETNDGITRIKIQEPLEGIENGEIYGQFGERDPLDYKLSKSPVLLNVQSVLDDQTYAPGLEPGYYIYRNLSDAIKDINARYGEWINVMDATDGDASLTSLLGQGKYEYDPRENVGGSWIKVGQQTPVEQPTGLPEPAPSESAQPTEPQPPAPTEPTTKPTTQEPAPAETLPPIEEPLGEAAPSEPSKPTNQPPSNEKPTTPEQNKEPEKSNKQPSKPSKSSSDMFQELSKKYGNGQTTERTIGKSKVKYIEVGDTTQRKKFKFSNSEVGPNIGSRTATDQETLSKNPVVLVTRTDIGDAKIFENLNDALKYIKEYKLNLNELTLGKFGRKPTTARPTVPVYEIKSVSGLGDYYVKRIDGKYYWYSSYDGQRVGTDNVLDWPMFGDSVTAFNYVPEIPGHISNLIGKKITSDADFAELLEETIYPMSEFQRYIFLKNNEIVGLETIHSNEPGTTAMGNEVGTTREYMVNKAKALDSDSIAMSHNHPGHSTPSPQDEIVDLSWEDYFKKNGVPSYGEFVIGLQDYSIVRDGNTVKKDVPFTGEKGKLAKNMFKNDAWTKEIHSVGTDYFILAKELPTQENYSKVFFEDWDNHVRVMTNISNEFLNKASRDLVMNVLHDVGIAYGCNTAIIMTDDIEIFDKAKKLPFQDVYWTENFDANGFYSTGHQTYFASGSKRKNNQFGYGTNQKRRSIAYFLTPESEMVDDEQYLGRDVETAEPIREPAHKLEKSQGTDTPVRGRRTTLTDFYKKNSYMAQQAMKMDTGQLQREERKATAKLIDFYRYIKEINKGRMGKLTGSDAMNAYGTHNSKTHWIRMRQSTNASSAIHEYGHEINATALNMEALNKMFDKNPALKAEFERACTERYGKLYDGKPTRKIQEGFAEAIRRFVEEGELFAQNFPNISALFANEAKTNKGFGEAMVHLQVMQDMAKDWMNLDPQERIHSNIDMYDEGKKDINVDTLFSRWATKIAENWFNDLAYLQKFDRDYAKKTGVKYNKLLSKQKLEDTYRLAGNAKMILTQLSRGYYDEAGNKITTGLSEIMEEYLPTKEEAKRMGMSKKKAAIKRTNDLIDYGVALREFELYNTRDDVILNDRIETIKAVIDRFDHDKKIKKAIKQINENSRAFINLAVEKKLISREAGDEIMANNLLYMPLNRVQEGKLQSSLTKQKGGSTGKTFYHLRGSDKQIENPLVSLMGNWGRILYNIQDNDVKLKMAQMAEETDMGEYFEAGLTPKNTYRGQVTMDAFESEIKKGLKTFGETAGVKMPIDQIMNSMNMDAIYQLFTPSKGDTEDMTLTYMDNGKRKAIQFADNDLGRGLYQAISGMNVEKSNTFLNIMNALNYPLKMGATAWNIEFALSNMQSDSFNRFLYSEGLALYIPYISSIFRAAKLVGTRYLAEKMPKSNAGQMYEKFMRSGASQEGTFRGENAYLRDSVKEVYGLAEDKLFGKQKIKDMRSLKDVTKKKLSKVGDFFNTIPEISEEATRFAEFCLVYNRMKAKGFDEATAIQEAGIKARQVTQDFTMQGKIMRGVNKVVPFASATIGGLYRFEQELRNHPARLMTRLSILAALAMALESAGDDDDKDYRDELNKQKRFDNFVMPNPFGDKQHPWIIKKPQGTPKYFLNFVQLLTDIADGRIAEEDIEKEYWDWLTRSAVDQFPITDATDLMPNVLQGLIENAMNKDFFYGTPIVSKDLEKLDPRHQYDEYTSEIAKAVGNAFNWSPLKIDNFIKSWTAGVGSRMLDLSSQVIRNARGEEDTTPANDISDTIGFSKLFANSFRSSESINRIYDRLDELETEEAEGRLTDEQQREYSDLQEAKSALAQINKKMKNVRADNTLDSQQKADKLDELKELRIDTARYYLGKTLLDSNNASQIETLSFYPANTTYTYTQGKKKYEVTFDETLQEEYAKRFAKEYEKELKALQRTSDYKKATASEKLEMEKQKKSNVRNSITTEMKKVAYKQQYKNP